MNLFSLERDGPLQMMAWNRLVKRRRLDPGLALRFSLVSAEEE